MEITWWHGCSKGDRGERLFCILPWGKGGSSESSTSWQQILPPSPPAAAAGTVWVATWRERHCMEGSSSCCLMGSRGREVKATCCRSEPRLFYFSKTSGRMALLAELQQVPIPISPARSIALLPSVGSWRMLPGGLVRSKQRRKGWAPDCHTARETTAFPLRYTPFSPCLKVTLCAIRSS